MHGETLKIITPYLYFTQSHVLKSPHSHFQILGMELNLVIKFGEFLLPILLLNILKWGIFTESTL